MNRIALTSEEGRGSWFDEDRAQLFKENTRWDGRNHISVATGSQSQHEWLYQTATGRYVLNSFSDWEGTLEKYELIEEEKAFRWLIANDHAEAVPAEEVAAREVGAGNTPKRSVRISDELWSAAQEIARAEGRDASKLLVALLENYVSAHKEATQA